MTLSKIVSGGQAGADRGALDAAIAAGFPCGGWCPRGRLAEDGEIPARYPLSELPTRTYSVRTERNVLDSDATLIIARGELFGGTALTAELARHHGRALLVVDLDADPGWEAVDHWLVENAVAVLNVGGPRESQCPGIAAATTEWIGALIERGRSASRAGGPGGQRGATLTSRSPRRTGSSPNRDS